MFEEIMHIIGIILWTVMTYLIGMAHGWAYGVRDERSEWRNKKAVEHAKEMYSYELAELDIYKKKYPPVLSPPNEEEAVYVNCSLESHEPESSYKTTVKNKWLAMICGITSVICLLPVFLNFPEEYYGFLRSTVTVAVGMFIIKFIKDKTMVGWVAFSTIVFIVFNPFKPVLLSRDAWVILDLVVGVFLGGVTFNSFRLEITKEKVGK